MRIGVHCMGHPCQQHAGSESAEIETIRLPERFQDPKVVLTVFQEFA